MSVYDRIDESSAGAGFDVVSLSCGPRAAVRRDSVLSVPHVLVAFYLSVLCFVV